MVIKIKGTQLDLTSPIKAYINTKLKSVERLIARIDENNVAEANIEVERTTHHHKRGQVYRAEINLILPRKLLRAEAVSEDVRLAINEAIKELAREIKKYKSKKPS